MRILSNFWIIPLKIEISLNCQKVSILKKLKKKFFFYEIVFFVKKEYKYTMRAEAQLDSVLLIIEKLIWVIDIDVQMTNNVILKKKP